MEKTNSEEGKGKKGGKVKIDRGEQKEKIHRSIAKNAYGDFRDFLSHVSLTARKYYIFLQIFVHRLISQPLCTRERCDPSFTSPTAFPTISSKSHTVKS